jgi:hypothetical protein
MDVTATKGPDVKHFMDILATTAIAVMHFLPTILSFAIVVATSVWWAMRFYEKFTGKVIGKKPAN